MKKHKLYEVLSFLLIFCTGIMSIFLVVPMFVMALSNPPLLLLAFVLVCVIIYTIVASRFCFKHLKKDIPAQGSTKAYLRINGFIALFFAIQVIIGLVSILTNQKVFDEQIQLAYNLMPNNADIQMPSVEAIKGIFKVLMTAMGAYALILLIHIFITFSLIRTHKHLL